jgi:hypothetical protein
MFALRHGISPVRSQVPDRHITFLSPELENLLTAIYIFTRGLVEGGDHGGHGSITTVGGMTIRTTTVQGSRRADMIDLIFRTA